MDFGESMRVSLIKVLFKAMVGLSTLTKTLIKDNGKVVYMTVLESLLLLQAKSFKVNGKKEL